MSKYTTEVRYICENYAHKSESEGYNSVQSILDNSWDKVFDFDFPIFDDTYKPVLCKKILKHYYTREICEETVGLWKLRLDSRMNEIMPYFNKLYDSELISIAPLVNNRYTVNGQKKKTGSDSTQGSSSLTETTGLTGSVVRTGGYTDTETGTDNKSKNGTVGVVNTKTGNETYEKDGKETDTKTGEITSTKEGQISDTNTAQGKTTEGYEGKGGKVTDTMTDLFSDTPNGSIDNMGDNYYQGSDVPIVGKDTSYLTTAEKKTDETEDLSKWEKEYGFSNDYEQKKTTLYGDGTDPYTEKTNYGDGVVEEKTFENRKDTKTYNSVKNDETTTYNYVDGETKNLTNQRVYNSQTDTTNNTGSKNNTGTTGKTVTYGGIDDYLENVLGSKGKSDSELLMEFRKTFLNIDEMIIARLSDLFMLLW